MANAKFWCLTVKLRSDKRELSRRVKFNYALPILLLTTTLQVCAGGLESLESFLKTAHSGRATFSQVVTPPVKAGQTAKSKASSGVFAFIRPTRFRFDYQKPYPLTLVADGTMLWWYDVDLAQVTARSQTQALSSSPAALIATASDLATLQKEFHLQDQSEADAVQWVQATPKREGALQSIRLGFADGVLKVLEMTDNFAQRSVLSFSTMELNPKLGADTFVFTPPKGADVVRP